MLDIASKIWYNCAWNQWISNYLLVIIKFKGELIMNLYERNQKQRSFFNEKIDEYDISHQEFMETKKNLTDSLDKDA